MESNVTSNTMGAVSAEETAITQPSNNNAPFRVFDTKNDWQNEINRIFAARFKQDRVQEKQSAASKEERLNAHLSDLKEGLAALKKETKDFDVRDALKNPEFFTRLKKGYSVTDAWFLANKDAHIASAAKMEAEKMAAKYNRPKENGARTASCGIGRPDVGHMSRKDFDKLLEEVRKGKVIK
ncbi:MAG: hypothetical protein Q8882_06005 [Bacillota bacterium]|nr:hypothetical protein [Bacillota bacterium]